MYNACRSYVRHASADACPPPQGASVPPTSNHRQQAVCSSLPRCRSLLGDASRRGEGAAGARPRSHHFHADRASARPGGDRRQRGRLSSSSLEGKGRGVGRKVCPGPPGGERERGVDCIPNSEGNFCPLFSIVQKPVPHFLIETGRTSNDFRGPPRFDSGPRPLLGRAAMHT